jgi:hypothetical protein
MISPTRINRLLTLSIEILVGIAIAVSIIFYAAHGPFLWMPHRNWIIFAIFSSVIFGVPVWWYREHWKRTPFWLAVVALLSAHLIGYFIFLPRVREFPPFLGPLSIVSESLVIFPLLAIAARTSKHDG